MKAIELKKELQRLEAEAARIRAEGEVIGGRIDSSKPGGAKAGKNAATQYRLRAQGQPARYLKSAEVGKVRAAIERGRKLKQIERQRRRMIEQLDRLAEMAAKLGLEMLGE